MRRPILASGGTLLLLGVAFALFVASPVAAQEPGPRFSEWGQAMPLGPPFTDVGQQQGCPFISKDDLNLYFRARVHPPGSTAWTWDIFVSHRESVNDPWGTPVNLGDKINTPTSNELCSFVTIDGHWIYFVSNRTDALGGTYGGSDIFVAHRKDKDDPTGWEAPVNLGPVVNTSAGETGPSIFEDEASGKWTMYFTRSYPDYRAKIWQVTLLDKDNPSDPTEVTELNTLGNVNMHTFVRRMDGLEVIFVSDRGNTDWWWDLWTSTRPSTSSHWSDPVRLGSQVDPLDPMRDEARPSLSWDGTTLYFWSDR
jgi:hypothetical protein